MRRFIGHGLDDTDLQTEEGFQDRLTLVTEALVWMPEADEKQTIFFSEDLLRESESVDEETAWKVWYCESWLRGTV